MPFVGRGPVVEEIDAQFWRVVEPLEYHGETESFEIPAGFRTDFASVPRPFVWLVPTYGVYTKAAILHDYLRSSKVVSEADGDGLFRRCLRECGVSMPQRWMMWTAVRLSSHLRGASPAALAVFTLTAVLSVIYLFVPAIVISVYLALFWLVEFAFWLPQRLLRRTNAEVPKPQVKSA
ncbi:hypothetical protein GCM10023318_39400 [Nocardia callitridis]|uniref:DUF1353 domain-containing protein n=1 Tax=Nocardia callitridis TaxID=648753 RepID=A0ABP9KHZ0_9NOCA